jgi:uncharacterized protein YhaN
MFIKEIHIDGFGIFNNKHVTGLTKGVNLLYGPNEVGKTTFLEFIRRILFGYPDKRINVNPYPAINGGQYGGRLLCELGSGDQLAINRTEGKHGGSVRLEYGGSEFTSQSQLNAYLGNISDIFYKNVYAFSLTELENVNSLQDDEIHNRIYGAGLQLGHKSLSDIKKTFSDHADSIFKPRGSSNELASILREISQTDTRIREIHSGLADYENMKKQKVDAEQLVKDLDEKLRGYREQKVALENLNKLFPNYSSLEKAKQRINELEDLGDFPEDALDSYAILKKDFDVIQNNISDKEGDLSTKKASRNQIAFNEELLAIEAQIIELQTSLRSYSDAKRDFETISVDKKNADLGISDQLARLGLGWTVEKIETFTVSARQEEIISNSIATLRRSQTEVEKAKIKLEQEQERNASKGGNGYLASAIVKNAYGLFTVLSLIGALVGYSQENGYLTVFSILIGIASLLMWLQIKTSSSISVINQNEKRLKDQLVTKEGEHVECGQKWEAILGEMGIDVMSSDGFEKVRHQIEAIRTMIRERDRLVNRLKQMNSTIDHVEGIYSEASGTVDQGKLTGSIESNIAIIVNLLEESKVARSKQKSLDEQILEYETKIVVLKQNADLKKSEIDSLITRIGVIDYEDLKRKDEILKEYNALKRKVSEEQHTIETTVGIGQNLKAFFAQISDSSQESIVVKRDDNARQIKESEASRYEETQKIGQLANQIEKLSSSEDLLKNQVELGMQKTKLKEATGEWIKAKIAQELLNKAISKYENTRQPEVINQATAVFSGITNSKYSKVIMRAEQSEIVIQDAHGTSKKVNELSRGTLEELYFAMRIGLIMEYEKRAEPMPFVMDDSFVNFDDDRRARAIEAITEFSKGRQIIILTCHDKVKTEFSLGANIVSI